MAIVVILSRKYMKRTQFAVALIVILLSSSPALAFTEETIAKFKAAQVGDVLKVAEPAGNGCNSCTCTYIKDSVTTVRDSGGCQCTLVNCPSPSISFDKPSVTIPLEPEIHTIE